jgi:hypothetical protein
MIAEPIFGAFLTDDDVAWNDKLTTKLLDA